ncbi:MAG: hypothetical protein IKR76_00170 [Ruminococcus sp.]|nr:hypothetical protein [Ruminococcus sp.]
MRVSTLKRLSAAVVALTLLSMTMAGCSKDGQQSSLAKTEELSNSNTETSSGSNADEFKTGYETLKQFCQLRAKSIRSQLDGTLSTETDKQQQDKQVSAGDLDIKAMGSQGGGKMNSDK